MTRQVELLVVDDNPGDFALIRESFKECPIRVRITPALDAERAFEVLDHPQRISPDLILPDLIILDLNLPRIDGFEVLRRIRAHPRAGAVPVVVMSSSTLPADVYRAYDLHASAYITKPSNLDTYFEIAHSITTLWLGPLSTTLPRPT
jgi:CheY-like chemotaxis protein